MNMLGYFTLFQGQRSLVSCLYLPTLLGRLCNIVGQPAPRESWLLYWFFSLLYPHIPIRQGNFLLLNLYFLSLSLYYKNTTYFESDHHPHLCCRQITKVGVPLSNCTCPYALDEDQALIRWCAWAPPSHHLEGIYSQLLPSQEGRFK